MQFVKDGPDIPDNLLFAHEEGRVVFFCGAGISMGAPAKLPSFKGLVEEVFQEFNQSEEWESRKNKPLEESLTWLENTIPGERKAIFMEVCNILNPNRIRSTPFHQNLLTLARSNPNEKIKLVTTNFDRLFENCVHKHKHKHTPKPKHKPKPPVLIAPRPPIPKDSYDWHGIVYLHGLIPENPSDPFSDDNLILTSGDFGRAYLSERWASRFVTELFKNYVVCFVGYSLNDPVMRYLMDALAVDERNGERLPERYIFLPKNGEESDKIGLKTILYDERENHSLLHDTFANWADYYEKFDARKQIMDKSIPGLNPSDVPPDIKFRDRPEYSRFMWAARDKDAARHFAEMNPRPSWEWIKVLVSREFDFDDLKSFGHKTIPNQEPDDYVNFSLLEPKLKFEYSPNCMISKISDLSRTDGFLSVEFFYRWIVRHLDNPEVALWFAGQSGKFNTRMKHLIVDELQRLRGTEGNPDPPIPPVMRSVWELFLSDEIVLYNFINNIEDGIFDWEKQFERNGLTPLLKRRLEKILVPKFKIKRNILESQDSPDISKMQYISQVFYGSISLGQDRDSENIKKIALEANKIEEKLYYIDFFHSLLVKVFAFADQIYGENARFELQSDFELTNMLGNDDPFIFDWHNISFAMIKLLDSLIEENRDQAERIVMKWIDSPYIYINRLGLHLLHEKRLCGAQYIAKILTSNKARLLTDAFAISQVVPLLEMWARKFSANELKQIQNILLEFDDGESKTGREKLRRRGLITCHLLALRRGGASLPEAANTRLKEFEKIDELRFYFETPKPKPDPVTAPDIEDTPLIWVNYLKNPPQNWTDPFDQGASLRWGDLCEKKPAKAFEILKSVDESEWEGTSYLEDFFRKIYSIIERHIEAQSNDESYGDNNNPAEEINNNNPAEEINIAAVIEFWLEELKPTNKLNSLSSMLDFVKISVSLLIKENKSDLIERYMTHVIELLKQNPQTSSIRSSRNDIVFEAINHPLGRLVNLIMQYQTIRFPKYDAGLSAITKQLLEEILSGRDDSYRYGLCIIARSLIYLFSYDRDWIKEKLIRSSFSWKNVSRASAAWNGYLSNAYWTPDLIGVLHDDILKTANHMDKLDDDGSHFCDLIGNIIIYEKGIILIPDFRKCVAKFNGQSLGNLLGRVADCLETVKDDQKVIFFENHIRPFFKDIWPSDKSKINANMCSSFERIIFGVGDAFPEAVELLLAHWGEAKKMDRYYYFAYLLKRLGKTPTSADQKKYAEKFPEATLNLLDKAVEFSEGRSLETGAYNDWQNNILVHLEKYYSGKNDIRLNRIKAKIKK